MIFFTVLSIYLVDMDRHVIDMIAEGMIDVKAAVVDMAAAEADLVVVTTAHVSYSVIFNNMDFMFWFRWPWRIRWRS